MERSRYLGVYINNYQPTRELYTYRVAIKKFINGTPNYENMGYFINEDAAAYVYNIYALATFGKGAVINDVHPSQEIDDEVSRYIGERGYFRGTIDQAIDILEEWGQEIRVYNHTKH